MMKINSMLKVSLAMLAILFFAQSIQAQYFGRNKVHYQTFDFDVHQTPHYDIYTYLEDDSLILDLAQNQNNGIKCIKLF